MPGLPNADDEAKTAGASRLNATRCIPQKLRSALEVHRGGARLPNGFLFRRFPKIPHGQVDIPGGKKTQHTRHARFAIDIALIVSLEVEGHEWSTCLRRLPGKELIKQPFPSAGVD